MDMLLGPALPGLLIAALFVGALICYGVSGLLKRIASK